MNEREIKNLGFMDLFTGFGFLVIYCFCRNLVLVFVITRINDKNDQSTHLPVNKHIATMLNRSAALNSHKNSPATNDHAVSHIIKKK